MSQATIALVGNPNSGKTSIFNELTGSAQFVGNWPGVTVERKEGRAKKDKNVVIQDLPGIYSLAPYTPEEVVARNYLIQGSPDGILNVVDGTNMERNLYLSLQLLDMGIPVVIALNMMDVLKKQNKEINLEKLSYGLGIPVVGTSAIKRTGIDQALQETVEFSRKPETFENVVTYDNRLETALIEIDKLLENKEIPSKSRRWTTIKLFEREEQMLENIDFSPEEQKELEEIIEITEKVFDDDSESIVINERYDFITKLVKLCVIDQSNVEASISDKIDRVVTNRVLALPIFALVMWLVYYLSIQTIGTMGTDWVNDVVFGEFVPNHVQTFLASINVAEWMQRLLLDGIIAGVGAVLGFLPQMMVLFLCLAILEDCGYMSRIAFVMDRLFRKFGLSGKSFIPMLIATGCGVPAIMASRTIENEKDRKITVMVTTFMPCSAKLPIIALIAGAFFPHQSWVAPSAYFVGMAAIVLSGILLKKTKEFSGETAPFIMELPSYHLPRMKGVLLQTWNRSKSFVKKAGTIIFVSSIIIWFTSNFNFRLQMVSENESILAAFGNVFSFLFVPLGWGTWQGTVAALTGLVAKENVVGTFGVLYGGLRDISENGSEIWPTLQAAYTPVAGYSFLLFNLLCAPCFAAIGAIHREMLDWKWTSIAVAFQCGLAYAVSLIVYQLGSFFFEGAAFGAGQVISILLIGYTVYLLVRKPKEVMPRLSTI